MKLLVFTNADNSVKIEYLTDIIGSNDFFTIYQITGLASAVQQKYVFPDLDFEWTLAEAAALADSSNLTLTIYETDEDAVVNHALDALAITESSLDSGTIDTAYTEQINVTGGNSPYTYAAVDMPTGVTIDADTGDISGLPLDAADTYTVDFTVTDDFGVEVEKTIDIVMAASVKTDILTYSMSEQTKAAVIDTGAHTVIIDVAVGTNLTALIATFTLDFGATAEVAATPQISATTPNNFTSPITFDVTAQDGVTSQSWTISATIFAISDSSPLNAGVNDTAYADQINVVGGSTPYVYAASNLPTGVTIDSGTGAITGLPLDTPDTYTVDVQITDALSVVINKNLDIVLTASEKTDFLTYSFPEQSGAAVIDTGAHTIAIEVLNGTDVTALVATFTMDYGAIADISDAAQTSGISANNFTGDVTYTVTAEIGSTEQDWVITVTIA